MFDNMKNYRTFAVTFRGGISTMSILKAFRRLSVKIAAFFSLSPNKDEQIFEDINYSRTFAATFCGGLSTKCQY